MSTPSNATNASNTLDTPVATDTTKSSTTPPSQTHLSGRARFLLAVTFFSMFFGAGNLIFPPLVGALSGRQTLLSIIGFVVSAVGLPILGVIVVARVGGFNKLASRVSPNFAIILGVAIMLTIGPLFAIPRTASTSFEMAVTPFIDAGSRPIAQLIYSLVFFALAFITAQHPDRLSSILGRIMGPLLLIMILALFVACLFLPHPPFTAPEGSYAHDQLVQGFLDGYQTMDLIAGLYFGIVITANIRSFGVTNTRDNRREMSLSGLFTGIMLTVVYAALAYIGAVSQSLHPIDAANDTGATVLSQLTSQAFGSVGNVFIGIIFIIACFNVCTSLISTCSSYFHNTFPTVAGRTVSYRAWSILFTLVSFGIANIGLSAIIKISIPVLEFLYPIAIVLVVLSVINRFFTSRFPRVYLWTVLFTSIASAFSAMEQLLAVFNRHVGWIDAVVNCLPLNQYSFGWLVPALVGVVVGVIVSVIERSRSSAGSAVA